MAAWALNPKERFLRQDMYDKRNFFETFSFIQSILLIMSNKILNHNIFLCFFYKILDILSSFNY